MSKSQSTTKRLLHELQSYEQDPSDALLSLGPVHDDELLHWTAVLKGVEGTAYEGAHLLSSRQPTSHPCLQHLMLQQAVAGT